MNNAQTQLIENTLDKVSKVSLVGFCLISAFLAFVFFSDPRSQDDVIDVLFFEGREFSYFFYAALLLWIVPRGIVKFMEAGRVQDTEA